jgi:hypothetical protein
MSDTQKISMPTLPTGKEFFNEVMGAIEPDLVMGGAELQAKYANETEADKAARLRRYEAAFEQYDKAAAERLAALNGKASTAMRGLRAGAETASRDREGADLTTIESSMNTAA